MKDRIVIQINGKPFETEPGMVVAAVLANAGVERFKRSPEGHARSPLCGMGVCFECAVTIDGVPHCRSCQTICKEGMKVETDHA